MDNLLKILAIIIFPFLIGIVSLGNLAKNKCIEKGYSQWDVNGCYNKIGKTNAYQSCSEITMEVKK